MMCTLPSLFCDITNTQNDIAKTTRIEKESFTNPYDEGLRASNSFEEIFEVVRRSVKDTLGTERTGLDLYLREFPLGVGAFHKIGTNIIVINRALINRIIQSHATFGDIKSFVYSILLHEYLHSIGIYNELKVRSLAYQISKQVLGEKHPATILAKRGPWVILNWERTLGNSRWS